MSLNFSQDRLMKLLEKIGPQNEVSAYLAMFKALPKLKFGVFYIDCSVLKDEMTTLADDIAIMNQLGIFPILVVDALSGELEDAINKAGGRAKYLPEIVSFSNRFSPKPAIDFDIKTLDLILNTNTSPILWAGTHGRSRKDGFEPQRVAEVLVGKIKPTKFILITSQGYITDKRERAISFINITDKKLRDEIANDWQDRITHFEALLKSTPESAVIITSPDRVLKEIFTVKGSGTFIKSHTIKTAATLEKLDVARIKQMLEDAFGKTLKNHYLEENFERIFYQKDYEGLAIMQRINDLPYLDKFAVGQMYQGTGLGKSLWLTILRKYPQLVWRATSINPLNSFYLRECTGCVKFSDWYVYWKNVDLALIQDTIPLVLNKTASFKKRVDPL